ncbi:MAG: nitroreductase family deazaflavin-dependent oxidoreductase [Acidimicrobiales bacterium]
MPLAPWVARFNRSVTNHLTRPLITHLPNGAVVVHRGRRSGREYRTPVLAFSQDDGFVIALTYGADVDWVRNVLAAGACRLERGGHEIDLTRPVMLEGDAATAGTPSVVRRVLRTIHVTLALRLDRSPERAI